MYIDIGEWEWRIVSCSCPEGAPRHPQSLAVLPYRSAMKLQLALCGSMRGPQQCTTIARKHLAMCEGSRPFIPAASTVRIQLIYTLNSQRIENVFHVLSGGGLVTADLDRIEGVFAAWWTATGRAQAPSNVSLVLIVADALNVESGLHKEYSTGWTAGGSLGSTALAGQNTMAVKLATSFSGRSFRGRIYWPGFTNADIVAGLVTTARRDAIVAAVNTLRASLTAGGDTLAVVSYCHNKVWRTTATVTGITGVSAKTTVAQQKRRRVAGA